MICVGLICHARHAVTADVDPVRGIVAIEAFLAEVAWRHFVDTEQKSKRKTCNQSTFNRHTGAYTTTTRNQYNLVLFFK